MLFNSYVFILVFLPLVVICVYFLRFAGRRWLEVFLILASLIFYAGWDARYLPLLLCSVVINYVGALLIERKRSRLALAAIIIFNITLIIYYKYLGFFTNIASESLGVAPWNLTRMAVVLPLGISFYTFQQIGYQIDRWRGEF